MIKQIDYSGKLIQLTSSFKVRFVTTVLMLGGFVAIISMGHFYCGLLVFAITCLIFKELIALKRNVEKDKDLPYFFLINWYGP
jgi:CDP-diglyceride synthetase